MRELGISMAHAHWRGRRTFTPAWQGCVWDTGLEGCVCACECTSDSSGGMWVSEAGSAWVQQHLHPKDARGFEGAAGVPGRAVHGASRGVAGVCAAGGDPCQWGVGRSQAGNVGPRASHGRRVQVWYLCSTGHKRLPWEMHRVLDILRTKLPAPYCLHIQRTWCGFLPLSSSGQAKWDPGNVHHEHSRPSQSQPGTDAQPGREAAPTSMSARGGSLGAGFPKPRFGEEGGCPWANCPPLLSLALVLLVEGWKAGVSGMWLWRLERVAVTHTGLGTGKIWV